MLGRTGEGEHLFIAQTDATIMEINVVFPQEARNQSTSRFNKPL